MLFVFLVVHNKCYTTACKVDILSLINIQNIYIQILIKNYIKIKNAIHWYILFPRNTISPWIPRCIKYSNYKKKDLPTSFNTVAYMGIIIFLPSGVLGLQPGVLLFVTRQTTQITRTSTMKELTSGTVMVRCR